MELLTSILVLFHAAILWQIRDNGVWRTDREAVDPVKTLLSSMWLCSFMTIAFAFGSMWLPVETMNLGSVALLLFTGVVFHQTANVVAQNRIDKGNKVACQSQSATC